MAMKSLFSGIIGMIVGVVVGLVILPILNTAREHFGPPRVTLINASGATVSSATISLNNAERSIKELKDGQSITVPIRGAFGESSIYVKWTDTTGDYEADAGGYMENDGTYHSTVILMPDKKPTLLGYEMQEFE
jgi:hypothetical protein